MAFLLLNKAMKLISVPGEEMDWRGGTTAPPIVVEAAGVNRCGRPLGSLSIVKTCHTTSQQLASAEQRKKLSSAPIKTSHHHPSE